jgi:hypothetical protein
MSSNLRATDYYFEEGYIFSHGLTDFLKIKNKFSPMLLRSSN